MVGDLIKCNVKSEYCILISILLFSNLPGKAQHILSQFEIRDGAAGAEFENMVSDEEGNIYVGSLQSPWVPLVIKDSSYYGFRYDSIQSGWLTDFFYCKFDKNLGVKNVFVIDNAEILNDYFSNSQNSFITMTTYNYSPNDSVYPILVNGEIEIDRQEIKGRGLLTILDDQLNVEKVIIPSTGKIGQVAGIDDFVYVELLIPDQVPYIVVGADTVMNWEYNIGGLDYGFQTIVLYKYNFVTDELVWLKRIGGVGYDFLRDMLIDSEGNLLVHGWTSSGTFHFSENDSSFNNQENKPFIAKYSPEGELLWSILNTNQNGELFLSISLDSLDNIYYLGEYVWPEYHIGDTVLYNPWMIPQDPTNRGIVIKYDKNGICQWATQHDGNFAGSNVKDVAIFKDGSIIISGSFYLGSIILGENEYFDEVGEQNAFLLKLNSVTGKHMSHAMDVGPEHKIFANLYGNNDNQLILFMAFHGEEEIFGQDFSSYEGNISGFIITMNTDFISSNELTLISNGNIWITPNPIKAGDDLYIFTNSTLDNHNLDYEIYDLSGQKVQNGMLEKHNGHLTVKLNNKVNKPGIYVLSILNSTENISGLFIIH